MMGLSINGAVSWAYSSFNMFRAQLAQYEGIDMKDMEGWGGDRPWSTVDTVLKPLLDHADDRGHLTPEECAQMHERLLEAVNELWPPWHYDTDGERGRLLAELMKDAAEQGYSLNFM